MGKGYIKQKNAMKKLYLNQAVKEIERLEAENKALKEDPNTVIGQFIGQFREMYSQNSRLSTLSACLIQKLGDKVTLSKAEMEQFTSKRINIKWEIPDGVEPKDATEFIFTYELQEVQPPVQPQPEQVECTDPNCSLPKDLKHTHTVPVAPPTEDPTVTVNEVPSPLEEIEPGDVVNVNGEDCTVTSVEHNG
jgi:hypothetical protein